MSYRKQLFGLDEVGAELEAIRVPRWHLTLLSDLQQSVLVAVVAFPSYREGFTKIPPTVWHKSDVVRFFKRPGRRGWKDEFDFALEVNDFYFAEEELLRQAVLSAALRHCGNIPREFREHMVRRGFLKDNMSMDDWNKSISWLIASWRELSDLNGSAPLYPMIEAHHMHRYLHAVKKDRSLSGKWSGDKHPGGRPENPHWPKILEAAAALKMRKPALWRAGKMKEFATCLHNPLKREVDESQQPLPDVDTIAQRLRRELKAGEDEITAKLK